jgi:hypothetical protein
MTMFADWNGSTTYAKNALVVYDGDIWEAAVSNAGVQPGFNTGTWRVRVGNNDSLAVAQLLADRAMEVNVLDFGASNNGQGNAAVGINAAIEFIRTKPTINTRQPYRLVFPNGVYTIESPINFTAITSLDCLIDGQGSIFYGATAAKPVIDAIGSRWLRMRDFRIVGDSVSVPRIGIQIGRYNSTAVDNNTLRNISMTGQYTLGALYNFCSETSEFDRIYVDNGYATGADTFGFVIDGQNAWTLASDFVTVTASANTTGSFNENLFLNCDIRQLGSGTAIWMAETARHRWISCYAAVDGARPAIRIFHGTIGNRSLDMDIHCETTDMSELVEFQGAATQVYDNFKFREHDVQAATQVFKAGSGVNFVSLLSGNIDLGTLSGTATKVFDDPTKFIVSCDVNMYNRGIWNQPRTFSGILRFGQSTIPVNLGSFRVQTTNNTATRASKNGAAIGATNCDPLENGELRHYEGRVIAYEPATGDSKSWSIECTIKRGANAAATALVGTPTVTELYADAGASAWTVGITADTTLGAMALTVTGENSHTIRWMATTSTTEVY